MIWSEASRALYTQLPVRLYWLFSFFYFIPTSHIYLDWNDNTRELSFMEIIVVEEVQSLYQNLRSSEQKWCRSPVHLSICLPAHLSTCLSACLPACLFVYIPVCLPSVAWCSSSHNHKRSKVTTVHKKINQPYIIQQTSQVLSTSGRGSHFQLVT